MKYELMGCRTIDFSNIASHIRNGKKYWYLVVVIA